MSELAASAHHPALTGRLWAMLDAAPDAIIGLRPDGRIEFWNLAAAHLFGIGSEHALGKPVGELLIVEAADADWATLLNDAGAQLRTWRELRLRSPTGRTVAVDLAIVSYQQDGDRYATAYLRDIGQRKAVESGLRQADSRLKEITETLPLAVFQFLEGPQGDRRYLFVGENVRSILGVTAAEIMRDREARWRCTPPQYRMPTQQAVQRAVEAGQLTFIRSCVEFDGRLRWICACAVPGALVDGSRVWNGFWMDESEAREQAEKLRMAKEQAADATFVKSIFLANMSHEVRTPMNGVIGMLELLQDSALTHSQREFVTVAQSSAESLLKLINDILDFSKIEAGKLNLESIPFDFLREMETVSSTQALVAKNKGLDLIVHCPPLFPHRMLGDPSRIRQVLTNLICNAIKFTEQGQVLVEVDLAVRPKGRCRLFVSVADTGIGLVADKVTEIFEKFTQADASTTRQYGGTGLGLTICKLLVELMGGQISVESRLGHGSRFWFSVELPLVSGAAEATAADAGLQDDQPPPFLSAASFAAPQLDRREDSGSFAGYRILVVDDNIVNRQVAVRMLEKLGCAIEVADDGQKALAMHAARHYDLILMDCQMPELDGYQATRLIRIAESMLLRRSAIVALTAHALTGEREKCLAAGMDDFMLKPIRPKALSAMLKRWLPAAAGGDPPLRDELDAVRKMFGADFNELAGLFRADGPPRLAALHAAATACDAVQLAKVAHALSGSAASLGAAALGTLCKKLEMCGKAGVLEEIAPQLAAIEIEYARIDGRLRSMLPLAPAQEPP